MTFRGIVIPLAHAKRLGLNGIASVSENLRIWNFRDPTHPILLVTENEGIPRWDIDDLTGAIHRRRWKRDRGFRSVGYPFMNARIVAGAVVDHVDVWSSRNAAILKGHFAIPSIQAIRKRGERGDISDRIEYPYRMAIPKEP